jgi:hypothetical protein
MPKNNSKILAALIATGIAALGIVQYLALSGLIPVSALARVHWIFLPAYSIGGAFGVLLQWFLIAAVLVYIMFEIGKRKRADEPGDSGNLPRSGPGPEPAGVIERKAPSFGRKPRV